MIESVCQVPVKIYYTPPPSLRSWGLINDLLSNKQDILQSGLCQHVEDNSQIVLCFFSSSAMNLSTSFCYAHNQDGPGSQIYSENCYHLLCITKVHHQHVLSSLWIYYGCFAISSFVLSSLSNSLFFSSKARSLAFSSFLRFSIVLSIVLILFWSPLNSNWCLNENFLS